MFDSDITNGVRGVLAPLHKSIVLTLSDPLNYEQGDMIESVENIAACNSNVSVTVCPDEELISKQAELRIFVDGEDSGISFSTVPSGNLLSPFLYAIMNASGCSFTIDKDLLARVAKLTTPVKLVTYIGRNSSITPRTLQIINELVSVNPLITNSIRDVAVDKDDVKRFGIVTLPTILCNDAVLCDGWNSAEDIVRALEHAAA